MNDPLGLFSDQASSNKDPLGLFSSPPEEDTRDWISKAIDTHLAGHPIAQQVADAANPIRVATALPGALAASARGAVEMPLYGLVGLGNIGQDGEDLVHKITTVGGALPKTKSEEVASQVIGEGFGKLAEAGGKTAAALDPVGIDDDTLKYLEKQFAEGKISKDAMLSAYKTNAGVRALGEIGSQMAAPIPGVKGVHGAIEKHFEGKAADSALGDLAVASDEAKARIAAKDQTRQQDVLFGHDDPLGLFPESGAPKSPYDIHNQKVDENGMPIDELRSQEIAKMDAEAAPQGDLLHDTGPGAIQLREGPFPSAKDRPDTIEQISNESSAESGSRSPEEGVHNPYMSVMDKDASPIETIPYNDKMGPGEKLLHFNDLPDGAKESVEHAEFMKSGVDVSLKDATFERVEIPIKDVEAKTELKPDNSKSHTEGPILLDREGRIVDGLHRVMDAKEAGKDTIEVYRPVADKSGRPIPMMMGKGRGGSGVNQGFIGTGLIKSATDAIMNKIRGEAKTPIEAAHEITKLNGLDRRSAKDMISTIDPSKAEDIGLGKKVVSNIMDVDGILANTAHTHGAGQILRWVRDSMKLIDRSATALKEDLLKGTTFEENKRGFKFRTEAKDSPVALFKEGIKGNVKDMNSMLREWFNSSRDGREPKFQTAQQKAIFDKWQGVFSKLHDEMNTLRKAAGLQAIAQQQSYFPLMRMGDYRILITDGNNNMVGSFHVPDVYYGKLLKNKLEKELPTLKIGDPKHLNKSKYDYSHNDFTAMEAASKALKDQPDVQAALHKAYAEVMQHRGFGGKHGVESQHLLGAMGLEDGHVGATRALEAFEAYTSRSVQYMANLEKKAKMAELMKDTPPELKQKLGNTFDLANDLYNNSKGSLEDKLKGVTDLINLAGRASGLGETGFRNKLRSITGLASTWLITTPSFIFSQIAQPATGFAGLMKSEGGGYSSIPFAGKDFLAGYAKTLLPSALDKEGVSWAAKNGYMTPEVADLMGFRGGDHTQAFTERVKAQLSKGGSVLEREAVRIPYFLMQLEAMKGKFKDKETMFEAAGEKTDRYMVDYNRSNQAMVWGKMGALGENSRQLKSFSNNMLGQYAEYLQDARHGDTSTLAVYLGTSVLLAGLTGNILLQTADDVIRGLNALGASFGQSWNIPTSAELVMKSMVHGEGGKPTNLDNIMTFGLGSTLLGHDISSSQAQNSAKSMLSVPVASLGAKTVKDVAPYLIKKYQGEDKSEDYMKFLLAITPPMAKEMVKSKFIENGLVPDPNHDMQKIYQREPEKRYSGMTITEMIGRASLDEVRATRIIQAAREDVKETIHDKQSAANALADRILSGQSLDQTLLDRWIKEGGDPRELKSVVVKRAMEKQFDFVDRTFQEKGNAGLAKQQSIEKDKKALGGLKNQSFPFPESPNESPKTYNDTQGMSQLFRQVPSIIGDQQIKQHQETKGGSDLYVPLNPYEHMPTDRVLKPRLHLDQLRKST